MIKKIIILFVLVFNYSCGGISFVYDNPSNLTNPLYNKTSYEFTGKDVPSGYQNAVKYFGNSEMPQYHLKINIDEEKKKMAVETNQAISQVDYTLKFSYVLTKSSENCVLYEKEIISRFSFIPKSSGYNYGSDRSLESMYELSVRESLLKLINFISGKELSRCLDES